MRPLLLYLDVPTKYYTKTFKFKQNGGHFGRHLGFEVFRNKFLEVDLLNIVCCALSFKISMVDLVCRDGGAKTLFSAFGPPLICK